MHHFLVREMLFLCVLTGSNALEEIGFGQHTRLIESLGALIPNSNCLSALIQKNSDKQILLESVGCVRQFPRG